VSLQNSHAGRGGTAAIPMNRTAASTHFGKMDALILVSVLVGLAGVAALLRFVLLSH
jgi:hypothetical protein